MRAARVKGCDASSVDSVDSDDDGEASVEVSSTDELAFEFEDESDPSLFRGDDDCDDNSDEDEENNRRLSLIKFDLVMEPLLTTNGETIGGNVCLICD